MVNHAAYETMLSSVLDVKAPFVRLRSTVHELPEDNGLFCYFAICRMAEAMY